MNVEQSKMRVAGSFRHQAEIEAVPALGFVSVHHADGLDELKGEEGQGAGVRPHPFWAWVQGTLASPGGDPRSPAPRWYLAWLCVLAHGCLVGCGQLWGVVIHIQDSDPEGGPGELGVIVCNKSTGGG